MLWQNRGISHWLVKFRILESINFIDTTQCKKKYVWGIVPLQMCSTTTKQCSYGWKNINIMRLHNEPPTVFTVNGEASSSSSVFWLFMSKKTAIRFSWRASATTTLKFIGGRVEQFLDAMLPVSLFITDDTRHFKMKYTTHFFPLSLCGNDHYQNLVLQQKVLTVGAFTFVVTLRNMFTLGK